MIAITSSDDFRMFTDPLFVLLSTAVKGDAVVLDIDATVLFQSEGIENTCDAELNPRGVGIYNLCINYNIPVFFVTARLHVPENVEKTMAQLQCMGFFRYAGLYMRPAHVTGWPAISQYKGIVRQQIAQKFNILLNVGDMWADLHMVTDESVLHALHKDSGNRHVLFKPHSNEPAMWALKLAETRH